MNFTKAAIIIVAFFCALGLIKLYSKMIYVTTEPLTSGLLSHFKVINSIITCMHIVLYVSRQVKFKLI
jgi:hypothetical protein